MKFLRAIQYLFFICFTSYAIGQSYSTVKSGDIESAQTWTNGELPPFIVTGTDLEIPENLELNINHELTTTRSEVINRGNVHIILTESDYPTIFWRNFGNIDFFGWAPDTGRFINESSGNILYRDNFSFCQHTGCGSENFGTLYVNTCLSNICAYDTTSRFINHENAEIIICEDGYLENYWRLPGAGSIDNLVFVNNGTIRSDEDSFFEGFISSGNDFFNGNPNSMGTYIGDLPMLEEQIDCISELPSVVSITNELQYGAEVLIYPNPSTGIIKLETSIEFDEILVFDHLGRKVEFAKLKTPDIIDLSGLEGLYHILLRDQSKTVYSAQATISY